MIRRLLLLAVVVYLLLFAWPAEFLLGYALFIAGVAWHRRDRDWPKARAL